MSMRAVFAFILIFNTLFGASLLNQNVYERENRVDLMLSFDAPFEGTIKKSLSKENRIDIKLTGVQVTKTFKKALRNDLVESIAITGVGNGVALVKITPANGPLTVEASRTVDGFGLRLRILPKTIHTPMRSGTEETIVPQKEERAASGLNTLKSSDNLPGWRYWAVLGIMLFLLLLLWIVKRKKLQGLDGMSWLMPKAAGTKPYPAGAVVRYQKAIDAQNRVVLLEWGKKQYLMVVGNSNLLLDTFSEEKIEDPESFSSLFEENKKQLDHFLKENHPDAYEAFKENASRDDRI